MVSTVFVNGVTLTDEDWANDLNRLHYTILGDPATVAVAKTTLLAGNRTASVYVYTAWDPSDVIGTLTNASSSSSATSTATDYVTVANASGTLTFTCVKAGVFRFTVNFQNEVAAAFTSLTMTATLGGTGTILLGTTNPYVILEENGTAAPRSGCFVFYAVMTAAQTITILPKSGVSSGGVTTNFTTQCTVSSEYTGA